MPDFHVVKKPGESAALYACRYVLERMRHDPNLAYYMLGTQSLELLVEAVAIADECSTDRVRKRARDSLTNQPARVQELRDEINALKDDVDRLNSAVDDAEYSVPRAAQLLLEPLLQWCQIQGVDPTVEAVREAMADKSLEASLQKMHRDCARC